MELNIDKFNPTKAEISAMVQQYKDFAIQGVDDHQGYLLVDQARKTLKKARVQIEKDGKLLRSKALAFQREVIAVEKELIGMIEPTEKNLEERQKLIDQEREMISRRKFLPDRIAKLKEIDIGVADDFLLMLDENQFLEFFNLKHSEYLQEQGRKAVAAAQAEAKRISDERAQLEFEKKKLEDAKLSMERDLQKQIEIEAAKVAEAARVVREMELKAKESEQKKQEEEAQKIADQLAEQAKLEKRKKYQAFLAQHGYNQETSTDYLVYNKIAGKIILYKKLGEFII